MIHAKVFKINKGYLDPLINIIHKHSLPGECVKNSGIPVSFGDKTYAYSHQIGALTHVQNPPAMNLFN